MGKYYSIDPETCSIEELKAAIEICKEKAEFFDACQQGVKIFLNSVYGAMAASAYVCNNLDIAESITLQGQDLIKYSANVINYYFANTWHIDKEVHSAIADQMLKKYPEFDKAKFMELASKPIQIGETLQVYGDSVTGDSMIRTETGCYVIEELFDRYNSYTDGNEKIRVEAPDLKVCAGNIETGESHFLPVKYIMRHYSGKRIFEIKCVTDHEISVKCTEDHSLIVCTPEGNKTVKPCEIDLDNDSVIIYNAGGNIYAKIEDIREIPNSSGFVYDICVDSDDRNWHTFFANDILVHNTDSVSKDSVIYTEKHPEGVTIEELYNTAGEDAGNTAAGHESRRLDDKVLNYDKDLYYGEVERIIRHKVSKPMWRLKTESGKEIVCTEDHSLIVFRNGEKAKVKPAEILPDDMVLCVE